MENANDPEKPTIWKEARNFVENGSYAKAVEIYKYLIIRFGENSIVVERANANLGDIYLKLKQPDKAETHIKKAIKRNPKKPDYHYLLGIIYSEQNRWRKAVPEFEAAIAGDPDNTEFLRRLGWAYLNAADKVRGMECLNKAKELAPLDVNILLDLANAYLFALDFNEAKRYAWGAICADPENALAKKVFDEICQSQRDYGRGKR
jgi:tetratricopeptide (TPR) repeat protein